MESKANRKNRYEDILFHIFAIGIGQSTKVIEKYKLDSLLSCGLMHLESFFDDLVDEHDTLVEEACIYRSAFQFLLDDYKDFPLHHVSIDMNDMDNRFRTYYYNHEASCHLTPSKYQKLVPKTHWWWWQ